MRLRRDSVPGSRGHRPSHLLQISLSACLHACTYGIRMRDAPPQTGGRSPRAALMRALQG